MRKIILRYRTLYQRITLFIICLVLYPVLLFVFKCLIVSGTLSFLSDNKALTVFNKLFSVLLFVIIIFLWQCSRSRIMIDEGFLSIKKCFSMSIFRWDEILEFGRFSSYSHMNGGAIWTYYIKTVNSKQRKIILAKVNPLSGNLSFDAVDQLCSAVFEKANRAKFIILKNVSPIPFLKRYKENPWHRDKESKESKSFMGSY